MDKSTVAVEESYRRSDSQASVSKSLGSLVQINSVAIDISCAMEEIESPAHDHFSIRGYVAGMRDKDWKICLPFPSEGDADDLVDNLPPLSVPRFRWWQCSNCIPDIAAERTIVEMLLLTNRSDASTSSCQNMCGEKDGLSSYSKQNIGDDHVSRDSCRNEEDNGQSNTIIEYNPRCTEAHKGTTCSNEKTDVRNNEDGNTHAYITQTKPFQIRERHNDDADAPDMVCTAENPSTRVDEPENASLGRDGAFSALPQRRKPKLRSLADIMEEVKNLNSEHPRMRSASSSGTQVTSAEIEADLDPQLQLDVPADIAKGTISTQRKRKTGFVEDREPLELTYPFGTAKRSKGPITDAEKTFKRVEISGIESEEDASTRMDMRLSAKTQQIKPKKSKALDISGKMRQVHIDNRTVPMREVPKINAVHSTNSNKHAVATETNFSNKGHFSSTIGGGMTQFILSSLSGLQRDRISEISKRPDVEADHSLLMPSSKKIVGDPNVNGKVALDLSLNSCTGTERNSSNQASSLQQHRGIPDLNVSFTEKTSMTQGKQLPYLSDNRSSTRQKNLDIYASCSKGIAREGKRQLGVSEQQPIQNMDYNVKHGGASDDIPMEIVELLAKNQHEKALANSRTMTEFIMNSIRGTPGVYMDGRPCMTNFPFTNTSDASGKTGVIQGTVNSPQVKTGQINIDNLDENQFRLFSSSRPSQQTKTHYSASNSIMSRWRPSEGADLLWPPRRKNVPFHLSATENHSIQPNSLDVHSFPDQCYKEKTIGDVKGCEKKAARNVYAVKQGRIGSSPMSVGSLDAYSNDAIPAMQLLSLMDRGIVPGSSVKVGSNSFYDKPFSPCNHHPRLNGNGSQRDPFHSLSFFSQSSHTNKDFPAFLNGIRFPGASLKKSYLQGQMPPQQGNSKAIHLEGPSNLVTQQSRDHLALGVCTLNRNPADFSIPDARNEYTISAKDLKPRKRRNSLKKERSRPMNVEVQKTQRMRKDAPTKVCSRK